MLMAVACTCLELGDRDGWERHAVECMEIAERLRLSFVLASTYLLRISLEAMRGDTDAVTRDLERLRAVAPDVAVPMQELLAPAGELFADLWNPSALPQVAPTFVAVQADHGMGASNVHMVLARTGAHEALVEHMRANPLPQEAPEDWATLADWASESEAAAVAGAQDVAAHGLRVLAPYAGFFAMGGTAATVGPVDGYLALLCAALGDRDAATAHADAAERIAREWDLTAYLDWLAGHRERLGV